MNDFKIVEVVELLSTSVRRYSAADSPLLPVMISLVVPAQGLHMDCAGTTGTDSPPRRSANVQQIQNGTQARLTRCTVSAVRSL